MSKQEAQFRYESDTYDEDEAYWEFKQRERRRKEREKNNPKIDYRKGWS